MSCSNRSFIRRCLPLSAIALVVATSGGFIGCATPGEADVEAAEEQHDDGREETSMQQEDGEMSVDLRAAEQRFDERWNPLPLDEPVAPDTPRHGHSAATTYGTAQQVPRLVSVGADSPPIQGDSTEDAPMPGPSGRDANCPAREQHDDGTIEITGGCTDSLGREWSGSVRIEPRFDFTYGFPGPSTGESAQSGEGFRLYTMSFDLSSTGVRPCQNDPEVELETSLSVEGEVSVEQTGDDEYEFIIDLWMESLEADHENCELINRVGLAVTYAGTVTFYNAGGDSEHYVAHEWNGEGVIGGEGLMDDDGHWYRVETTEQRLDLEECEFTPLSGSTTLHSGERELEFRYTGAEICDGNAEPERYLDGELQETAQ